MNVDTAKIEWARSLKVGDMVCNCKAKHLKIVEIYCQEEANPYEIFALLEDNSECSIMNCCESVDHEWKHPEDAPKRVFNAYEKEFIKMGYKIDDHLGECSDHHSALMLNKDGEPECVVCTGNELAYVMVEE